MALSHLQLTPQFVQAVRDAVDIVEIASAHTKVQRAGRKWKALCPFHKEKTPSFQIDAEQGLYYCFGCGKGGDAIKLHMELTGDDFPAAMEALAARYGISAPAATKARGTRPEPERDLEAVLATAGEWFSSQLADSASTKRYLAERKIPPALVESCGLGFAPDGWRNLSGALQPKIPMADLLDAGLAVRPEGGGEPYDRFRNRLIVPIRNGAGRLVGFGGRTLGDDKAKYVNTAETERFHKGSLLYGLDKAKRALRDSGRALLVEGYFDQIAALAAGLENAVASMGTALTPEQAKLLARHAEEVVIGYDGDSAGEAAARRALPILLAEGLAVKRARFGAGHDPDSLRRESGDEALRAAFAGAEDFVILEIDRIVPTDVHRNPHARSKAAKEAIELLAPIRDAVLKYSYGRMAADRLGVPAQLLLSRLGVGVKALSDALATPGGTSSAASTRPSPGQGAEEAMLRGLLWLADSGEGVPELASLPPEAALEDPQLRNIYALCLALYGELGRLPGTTDLRQRLATEGGLSDRASRLLLESRDSAGESDPRVHIDALKKRWLDRRRLELNRDLRQAEATGNTERSNEIRRELDEVKRERYPSAPHAVGTR
jgi:DNA primase